MFHDLTPSRKTEIGLLLAAVAIVAIFATIAFLWPN